MSRPLRIALLVDPLTMRTKGGAHAPALARELLGRGHVVRGFGAPPGVIPHSTGPEREDAEKIGLEGFAPDALVAYDALSPAAWLGARTARKHPAALVLVEGGIAWSSVRLHERILQKIGERLWGSYVRDNASSVVALDPVARDMALREGFPAERVTILPEGVDVATYRPGLVSSLVAQHNIRGRIILYVGPLDVAFGLETLIAAFARTVGQREDWALVIAGEGAAGPRLRAYADRLGIGARVLFLPRARAEELPGLMGASTLLAAPALDDVPRGRQVVRAMACGLPVLASDVARMRYFVQHEETGLLAPPRDVHAWAATLQRAAGAPEARKRWGTRARRIAEERFAWPVIAQALEELLVLALDRKAERRKAKGEAGPAPKLPLAVEEK